jgi:hypothetical protein
MPEHDTHMAAANGAGPVNPSVAFETEDVSVGGVERAGAGMVLVVIAVLVIVAGVYHYLTRVQPVGTPEIAAGVRTSAPALPPAPRMQGLPGDSVPPPEQQREFQAAAAAELHSYGWVDAQAGIAHVPIEDAMDELVKTGWPQSAAPSAAKSKPLAAAAKGKKAQ